MISRYLINGILCQFLAKMVNIAPRPLKLDVEEQQNSQAERGKDHKGKKYNKLCLGLILFLHSLYLTTMLSSWFHRRLLIEIKLLAYGLT